MIKLNISNIAIKKNKYIIFWHTDQEIPWLTQRKFTIEYEFDLPQNYFMPLNIIFSCLIPLLINHYKEIQIETPFILDNLSKRYWNNYLKEMFPKETYKIDFIDGFIPISYQDIFKSTSSQIGLLFGGGVESLFALSTMYHKKPILLSVTGRHWMNSDNTTNSTIKEDIIKSLCKEYNLKIQKININLRPYYRCKEDDINKYITGALFYFLTLPVANQFKINTIYQSAEFEYAEQSIFNDFDLSINPYFTRNLYIKHDRFPIMFSIYNSFPKIKLLELLSKTNFFKYLYSCYKNIDKRWCGKCTKCFRLNQFFEILGLDKSAVEMQEGIIGLSPKTPVAIRQIEIAQQLYPNKKII